MAGLTWDGAGEAGDAGGAGGAGGTSGAGSVGAPEVFCPPPHAFCPSCLLPPMEHLNLNRNYILNINISDKVRVVDICLIMYFS